MSAYAAAIPCPVCLHIGGFSTVQSLKDRLIFVSTNKIVCPVCQEEVVGLDKLTIHLFSHVNIAAITKDDARQKNSKLKAIHENPEVEKHKEIIPKNKFSATAAAPVKFVKIYPKLPVVALNTMPVINSNLTNNSMLIRTVTADSPIDENHNTSRCDICGVRFINEDILKMHNSIIHDLEDKSTQPTKYHCHLCSKYFKMRGSLMVHLRVAHYGFTQQKHESDSKVQNGDQKVVGNIEDSEKPFNFARNGGKQWQCDVCNKYFTTKYFLKKHKRLHTGETPYSCSQCNKTFTFQQSYHKHLLYHNDDKPHTCSYCGRAFKELSTLHNHQRIHTGEKPFACETCGKCFRQRVSYLVHRRIHTGAMPYKCTACDKTFRYKVSQRTHKCSSQLPGVAEDFVEKLSKTEQSLNSSYKCQKNQLTCSGFSEISEVNAELIRTGAQISLEDMESENFSIIPENIASNYSYELGLIKGGISNQEINNSLSTKIIDELIDSVQVHEKNVPSPSDILKNLCLSNEDDYLDSHD